MTPQIFIWGVNSQKWGVIDVWPLLFLSLRFKTPRMVVVYMEMKMEHPYQLRYKINANGTSKRRVKPEDPWISLRL